MIALEASKTVWREFALRAIANRQRPDRQALSTTVLLDKHRVVAHVLCATHDASNSVRYGLRRLPARLFFQLGNGSFRSLCAVYSHGVNLPEIRGLRVYGTIPKKLGYYIPLTLVTIFAIFILANFLQRCQILTVKCTKLNFGYIGLHVRPNMWS